MQRFKDSKNLASHIRGRGYGIDIENRFSQITKDIEEDYGLNENNIVLTKLKHSKARSIITENQSPDVPFERSINAYRGCEHGCIYCFARLTHSYLELSPGLEFETKIFYKSNAAELLKNEFNNPNYIVKTISLGNITDAYQPIERRLSITRELLNCMLAYKHPVNLVTKSSLIERDIDILEELAKYNLVHVTVSITTLDKDLARKLEPRASTSDRRLQAIHRISCKGIPVSVLMAPVIPVINDSEIESIIEKSSINGASAADYVMLRLPNELKILFSHWLKTNYPLKVEHVFKRLKEMHGGVVYKAQFGKRMRGSGHYAKLIEDRFVLACKQVGLKNDYIELNTELFERPNVQNLGQLEMF